MEKENIAFNKSEHWKGVNAIRKNVQNKSAYWYITKFGSSKKEDGTPNGRSVENSNKAEILRPDLYKRYFSDTNLSFFFSDDPTEERTDREIIESFAKRK